MPRSARAGRLFSALLAAATLGLPPVLVAGRAHAEAHPAPEAAPPDSLEAGARVVFTRNDRGTVTWTGGFVALRASRVFSLGLYGELTTIASSHDACRVDDSCPSQRGRYGIFARAHLAPSSFVDPWVSLGGGGGSQGAFTSEMEWALGADLRVDPALALGPTGVAIVPLSGGAPIVFGGGFRVTFAF